MYASLTRWLLLLKTIKAGSAAKDVTLIGVMTALALIFSYVEVLIPFNFGIPGVKLGLANLVIVVALYLLPIKHAFLLDIMKILTASFLFGNVMTLIYSLAGGLLSFVAMALAKKTDKLSLIGVSVLGGVFHNLGQLITAILVMETLKISYYFSVLAVAGLVTGLLLGIAAEKVIHLLEKQVG